MLSDDGFRRLLDRLDRPWAGYRKVRKGVKKRLRRHMTRLGRTTIEGYLDRIDGDPAARAECENLLTVTISRFLRDRRLWDHLEHEVLPHLADRFGGCLDAWSAGCANGEEPYSLAMTAIAAADTHAGLGSVRMLATDAQPACLERAKEGLYPASSLKEVPEDRRNRFFQPTTRNSWRVAPGLGENIHWKVRNLLDDPPQGSVSFSHGAIAPFRITLPRPLPSREGVKWNPSFHLILLRNNLLTYYRGPNLKAAFDRIVERLGPGGVLVVGSHEQPPPHPRLTRSSRCPWVYWAQTRSPAGIRTP